VTAAIRVLAASLSRDWAIARSYRLALLLAAAQAVGTLTVFYYLSDLISGTSADDVLGTNYFDFVAVGLAVLIVVDAALVSTANRLREDQVAGTLESLLTVPASPLLVILSGGTYALVQAVLSAILTLLAAVTIFQLEILSNPLDVAAALSAFLLGVLSSLWIGLLLTAAVVVWKRVSILIGFTTAVLSILGGVYYPVEVLPPALEAVAEWLPLTATLEVIRPALAGEQVPTAPLIFLAACQAVLLPAALWSLNRGLRHARMAGTLSHY
jgi:ABC-2 type transport system permease protein